MLRLAITFRTGIAVLAIAVVAAASAQSLPRQPSADTVWHCWYNQDSTFRCRLAQTSDEPAANESVPPASALRPSLYPKRGPLPEIVRTIQEHPGRLRGRTITIPLFTPPVDRQFAALLVRSVMCGARPSCETRVFQSSADAVEAFEEDPARDE